MIFLIRLARSLARNFECCILCKCILKLLQINFFSDWFCGCNVNDDNKNDNAITIHFIMNMTMLLMLSMLSILPSIAQGHKDSL